MRRPSSLVVVASPVARAANSLLRMRVVRDSCGKWPATRDELLRSGHESLGRRLPPGTKPSVRVTARARDAELRAFSAKRRAGDWV